MIEYFDDYDIACIDGYSFRRDKKTGYYLSSKKIGKRRVRLHVYVWTKANGAVPKGFHVHHIDGNKYHNELSNLCIIEGREHVIEHAKHFTEESIEKAKKNLIENAIPKAAEWHKSDEGRDWHKKHGVEAYAKRQEREYVCTYCGKRFKTTKIYAEGSNMFCSNNCKSTYRRKTGIDDIEKICECCGSKYIANKYTITKYCPSCKRKKGQKS